MKSYYSQFLPAWAPDPRHWFKLAVLGAAVMCAKWGPPDKAPAGELDYDVLSDFWPDLAKVLRHLMTTPASFDIALIAATSRPFAVSTDVSMPWPVVVS